jgi:plastocyanin
MGKRLITLAAPLVAAALVAAGCGGGDDNSSGSSGNNSNASNSSSTSSTTSTTSSAASGGGGGSTIKLGADPGGALKFDKTQLTAKAGNVTIDFDNPSQNPHAVEVEGNGLEEKKTDTITGSSAKLTLGKLKPGKYEFYCPVDGHKQAGMKGTLTVS